MSAALMPFSMTSDVENIVIFDKKMPKKMLKKRWNLFLDEGILREKRDVPLCVRRS